MLPDVALRVVVGRLVHAAHPIDLRQHHRQQAGLRQQLEAAAGTTLGEDLHDLVADPLGRDVAERGRGGDDRRVGGRVDPESEPGREAHGAQHSQAVLGDAGAGVPDGADHAGTQVGDAADEVVHLAGQRILEERVDGEVAPAGIVARGAEVHRARPPAVDVGVVGAEGGHLEARAVLDHEDHPELHADRHGPWEQRPHGLRPRAGRHVPVERRAAEQPVADAPPRQVGLVTGGAQPPHDVSCQSPPIRHVGT